MNVARFREHWRPRRYLPSDSQTQPVRFSGGQMPEEQLAARPTET